ncbi:hypothetical protein BOTBODRAFT_37707 [Botryobasidium botryosum FD-172 SS1]|uniref:C2H2-type domain-containing protein n=1 Tax=Botryobasidium botryosum (strain FD-172 SS1) TaxID=930990 RepID=A0A067MA28_BOTB1|nr:hypothetical protein BOTBODRAFT_37707 [Botryobasidium botryosum FD-172 SS1]
MPSAAIPIARRARPDSWAHDTPLEHFASAASFDLSMSPVSRTPDAYRLSEHLPRLELDFCKNYTCCGLVLPDMHDLVRHFEESHSPFAHSSPSSPSDTSSSVGPSTPPSAAHAFPGPGKPAPAKFCAAPDRYPMTAFPVSHSPPTHYYLPPSLYQRPPPPTQIHIPARPTSETPAPRREPEFEQDDRMSVDEPEPVSPPRSRSSASAGVVEVSLTDHDSDASSPNSRGSKTPGRKGSKRERSYVCPRPGCTKTYLNPNGLRYHLNKGTCTT